MADVSVKMGVSGISQFKSAMNDAQNSIKTLDAALKYNEKQLKAGANAEKTLEASTTLLNAKMKEQKKIADNATAALKKMDQDGVAPTSKAYQDMQRRLIEAQSAMLDTQEAMDTLGQTAAGTAEQAGKLEQSLGGLNKKVSLQQVINGVGAITKGLESAAKKAENLGKKIWENITDSARWADDAATQAMILNMNVEDYQRYKKVFDTVGEITVQEWQKAKQKVQAAIYNPTDNQESILSLLGINTHEMQQGKYGMVQGAARDFEDIFWEIGETLRAKVASGEMTQDLADTYANAIFGKGFAELNPMFALGKEGFAEELAKQKVNTDEEVEALAKYNDKLNQLKGDVETLENKITAGFAPALTKAAEVLDSLLGRLMEYLDSEEGQQALDDMAKAVEGLFEDLGKIDPEQVVQGFADVFNGIVGGLRWMVENKSTLEGILTAIVTAWGGAKLIGGALQVKQLIDNIRELGGAKGVQDAINTIATGGDGGGDATGSPTTVPTTKPTTNAKRKISNLGKTAMEYAAPVLGVAGTALGVYELVYGSMQRAMESWNEDVAERIAALAVQENSFTEASDSELVNAWKLIREHADDDGFLDKMAERYYKFTKSGDEASEYIGYTDDFWDTLEEAYNNDQISTGTWDALTEMMDKIVTKQFMQKNGATGGWETLDLMETMELLNQLEAELAEAANDNPPEVPVEPVAVDDAAELLEKQIGTVNVPANIIYGEEDGSFANGIWAVPFDGYRAILHKGERVVPAREAAASRNFSSNLYVENMNMNGGVDAAGLAAAIASRNRRVMAGFGS